MLRYLQSLLFLEKIADEESVSDLVDILNQLNDITLGSDEPYLQMEKELLFRTIKPVISIISQEEYTSEEDKRL